MNPRSAVQGRLGVRCKSVQALQEVQAGGLLRTAQSQPLPPLESPHSALPLWEGQACHLKNKLKDAVGLQWGKGKDFGDSAHEDGANCNGGGIHQKNGTDELRLLIHFKNTHAIVELCQLRLGIVL
jgi:hypothetical protein